MSTQKIFFFHLKRWFEKIYSKNLTWNLEFYLVVDTLSASWVLNILQIDKKSSKYKKNITVPNIGYKALVCFWKGSA